MQKLEKKKSNGRGLNSRFREIEECVWGVCGIWRTVDPVPYLEFMLLGSERS